jgi:hypothetical protein
VNTQINIACIRRVQVAGLVVLLAGCVQNKAALLADGEALLQSPLPITELDGNTTKEIYRQSLNPGSHDFIVRYDTYKASHFCHFEFTATAGDVYEVVQRENPEPLVLFHLKPQNWAWQYRLDPVDPSECIVEAR